jgi:glycerate 2-kinase
MSAARAGPDRPRAFLRGLFDAAVAVADPMRRVPEALPPKPAGRVVVVGAGKASARMAEAVESVWGPCEGLVITRDGYGRPCRGIEIVEAAHPVPDARGLAATSRMLTLLDGLGEGDFVLALISGGGSALLVQPAGAITLAEMQAVNRDLLASGAPIEAMNTVRKHLSRVAGGQLAAAAHPARMLALMISDVPGDDPAFIASGPTVGDATRPQDARAILDALGHRRARLGRGGARCGRPA